MKRTKLSDRALPDYSRGEEQMNTITHIVGGALIKTIKNLVAENSKIYKEKKFMICASPKEILGYGNENKVLIQGIIDFFAVGEKIVLIDYKYSLINNDEKLKEKYKNQLKIYSFALQKFLNREVDEIYLLNLRNSHIFRA